MRERFSNGDDNKVKLVIRNRYPFRAAIRIIDELPVQFQKRDFLIETTIEGNSEQTLEFILRPKERGEYIFHDINVFVKSPLKLIIRRIQLMQKKW